MQGKQQQEQEQSSESDRRAPRGKARDAGNKAASTSKTRRSKVRTGCRTCKVRRLKCDETRPACLRCTSTGRMCDGYGPLAISSLPFDIPGTEDERRSYHYFRLKTAPTILGSQDATYWTSALLHLAYSQPAIKHALIAIASIHEALEVTDWYMNLNDNDRGRVLRLQSWRQYNQAIQTVLTETSANRMPVETLMILCLLFNQYENFQCNYGAANSHIKSGLKLLEQWNDARASGHTTPATPATPASESTNTTAEMIREHVKPMLTRLHVQASLLEYSTTHSQSHAELSLKTPPIIPFMFETFSEARQMFDHAASWMFHNLGKGKESCDEAKKAEMRALYEQWWHAFGSLVGQKSMRLGGEEDRAARLLRVYYNFIRIVLETYHDADEMNFDFYTERFDMMVQQAQDLVNPSLQLDDHSPQPFSFDISLAAPLNYIGARCRVPHLRRQAVAILKAAQKTSFNCEHCSYVIQHLIDVEEDGIQSEIVHCSQIPREKRVRRIHSEVLFEEGHIKTSYVPYPHTAETPVAVAMIPMKKIVPPLPIESLADIPPVMPDFLSLRVNEAEDVQGQGSSSTILDEANQSSGSTSSSEELSKQRRRQR